MKCFVIFAILKILLLTSNYSFKMLNNYKTDSFLIYNYVSFTKRNIHRTQRRKPCSKFHLKEKNDEKKDNSFINPLNHSNIFRNKYNYIPSLEEIKNEILNFKKKKPSYFTEHSILEVIKIEHNIIVLNIEGKFFEDTNIVFADATKHLLNAFSGILGVQPYNIKSLNIKDT